MFLKQLSFGLFKKIFRILTKIVKTICSLNPLQVLSCTEESTLGKEGMEKGGWGGGGWRGGKFHVFTSFTIHFNLRLILIRI